MIKLFGEKQKIRTDGADASAEQAVSISSDYVPAASAGSRQYMLPAIICFIGIVINVGGRTAIYSSGLPLYFDTAGTILAAFLGGYVPGIATALLTNILNYLTDSVSIYYGAINVLLALVTTFAAHNGKLRSARGVALYVIVMAAISAGIGGIITWVLQGMGMNENETIMAFLMKYAHADNFAKWCFFNFLVNIVDKTLAAGIAWLFLYVIPQKNWEKFELTGWKQTPLTKEQVKEVYSRKYGAMSLNARIVTILTIFSFVIAATCTTLSLKLFEEYSVQQHTNLAIGVARMAAAVVEGDRVDYYLNGGNFTESYKNTQKLLQSILRNTPEVEYIYVYKILPDGCHVVFDVDTESLAATPIGEIEAFDSAFMDYLPNLLSGNRIEPMISDDKYGWLLTAYEPVYDSDGLCACYAGVDIAMQGIVAYGWRFLAKLFGLFSGFFFLTLAVVVWMAKYRLLLPIDSMAYLADNFKYDDEYERKRNVQELSQLGIKTGGEIENLYRALLRNTEESTRYFEENRRKLEKIDALQANLVMVLAEFTEKRDETSGIHVRRTAAFMDILAHRMKELGYYRDEITDEFIHDVVLAAPLHDIGKIAIPDEVLKKHGQLSEAEQEIMKTHATEGRSMMEKAMEALPDADYLAAARDIAGSHHERWDGTGYPQGISGEKIPLSARLMAVVDAFDNFMEDKDCSTDELAAESCDSILEMIKNGSGTAYDPLVADAFIKARDEIIPAAQKFACSPEQRVQMDSKS